MYANRPENRERARMTVPGLRERKTQQQKITSVTAYDASFAAAVDAAGIDAVLVGDSLGNVIQGQSSTLAVTLDEIIYHGKAVARGLHSTLLIVDLPFMSYRDVPTALDSGARVMRETGAAMVKVEGADYVLDGIDALARRDIPVCAHLGLTPQSVHKLGGYRVQGKTDDAARQLLADAQAVQDAGADALVLECVPAALAAQVTAQLQIPTIGIGAGVDCDGQILVIYDLLGITPGKRPRFSKDFLIGRDSIAAALQAYADAVRDGSFPAAEHTF